MVIKWRQIAKVLVRIAVTTLLLVWVFRKIDFQQFRQTVENARWQYLIAVWGFTAIFFLIQSISMQIILKKQGCTVSLNTLLGASAVTSLYSMILPGILSTGVKWYILKKDTGKGLNVLSSMLYNQLALFVVITAIGLTALIITNPGPLLLRDTGNSWIVPTISAILLVSTVALCVLLLNARTGARITTGLSKLLRHFPGAARQKGQEVLDQIAIFQNAGVWFHLKIALLTLTASLAICVCVYASAAKAANIIVPVGVLVWVWAVVFALGRIPISVANLGVREVTVVGLLALYGIDRPSALLMSMILFSCQVFMAMIGVAYQVVWAMRAKSHPNHQAN